MSENLFQLYTTQFTALLEMKLQQRGSKLRGKVREGSHTGKMASPVNQVGPVQMRAPSGRFAPLNRVDAAFTRRWVFPVDAELPQLIDTFDELKTIVDPQSEYVSNAAAAAGRFWDDTLINAAFATAQIGTDANGLSPETFNASTTVGNVGFDVVATFGSSAASGLTVAKLIEARRTFRHYHVDIESDPLTLVIGSQQESDLLNQTEVVSTEFNDRPVLTDGVLTRFLGFNIVVSERLTISSNTRKCIVLAKSGLYLGLWKDLTNRVSIRDDLSSQPYQLYTSSSVGATRIEPGRLLEIDCNDLTGADITP